LTTTNRAPDEQPTEQLPRVGGSGEVNGGEPDEAPTEALPAAAAARADGEPPAQAQTQPLPAGEPPGNGGPPEPSPSGTPLRLAEGIELIGVYEGSGFKDPPYIARRADGQVIQLPPLLYFIAEEVDGQRSSAEIAERISERLKRGVSADNVEMLADEKLRPLGVLAQADGSSPELEKADPLLALKFRTAVVPKRLSRVLTSIFYPFYFPPVVLAVLAGLVAVDVWFFGIHGAAESTRTLLYNPLLVLMVLGLVVLATALHEIGHATATRYGGAEPGVMGVGVYIVWPAFYTDVTDAYRLGRGGRLRTDLGGVYFNVLFILGIAAAYAATGYEAILILIPIQHLQIIQQFLPFLRLDGYYILSDLTGVPDMFQRIKPTLKSLVPFRSNDDRVEELKPWARFAIAGWVIALIPIMVFTFGMLVFNLPRMAATAWDSFWLQSDKASSAWGDGQTLSAGVAGMQAAFLLLPIAGIVATFTRIGRRVTTGAWSWSSDSVFRRGLVLIVTGAAAGVAAFVLLPNGDYRPIQPGERGTIQGGLAEFESVASGRPGLTEEREQQLGGAPSERDRRNGNAPTQPVPGETTTDESTTTSTETTETATSPTETTTTPSETTPAGTQTTPAGTPTSTATTTTPTDTTGTTTTTETTTTQTTTTETTTTPTPEVQP
jgi:putative peptide zinc metalloprotease protein